MCTVAFLNDIKNETLFYRILTFYIVLNKRWKLCYSIHAGLVSALYFQSYEFWRAFILLPGLRMRIECVCIYIDKTQSQDQKTTTKILKTQDISSFSHHLQSICYIYFRSVTHSVGNLCQELQTHNHKTSMCLKLVQTSLGSDAETSIAIGEIMISGLFGRKRPLGALNQS